MRTKHLLYTMALAGTFAACMQEEFVTVDSADALAGRKSIGKITFTEAPSTRWAVEDWDEIKQEDGDAFSLMLVDVPREGLDGQHVYPIDNYQLINKLQTNFIFRKGANGWGSDAELVEGNYLYVAPAQEGKLDRNTVEITLPTEQNLSLGADGKLDPLSALKDFVAKKYPFYIGHRFLSEDGSINLPDMQHIFAYPEITVKNTDRDGKYTPVLTKVIIKQEKAEDAFVINAPLQADEAAKLLTNEYFEHAEGDTDSEKDKVVVGEWAGHMSEYFGVIRVDDYKQVWENEKVNSQEIPDTEDFAAYDLKGNARKTYMYNKGLYGATSELLGNPKSKSQYIVINMPGDGIALEYGNEIKFNAVIPAATYKMTRQQNGTGNTVIEGLTIYAVLENGEGYRKVVGADNENYVVDMYPGKRYPAQDYTNLEVKGEAGLYFTVDLHDGATDGMNVYEKVDAASIIGGVGAIDSTEDLIAAIKAHTSTERLNLTVEGRNVVYNEEVNKAVANTDCQSINIQGNIKVEGEEDAAKNAWTINPKVTIEDAVIEKGKVAANENSLKQVFVAKNAELTLNDVTGKTKNATIYNAGILTLNTADFADVKNYGKLKVGTDLSEATNIEVLYAACGEGGEIISPSIDLKPSVEVLAGGTYAISGELDYPITVNAWTKANKSDAGVLKLSGDASIVKVIEKFGNKEVEKIGNIINNGKVSGNYGLTVDAGLTMTVGTDAEVGKNTKVIIEGASHKLADMTDGVTDYKPAAQVINNGTLNDVEVNGLLVMGNANARVDGTVSYTAENADEGEIDNTAKGVIAKDIPEEVVVFATINEINLDDHANTVKALKDYTTSTRKVTVFRLTGELKRVQSMENGEAVKLTNAHVGDAVTAIEFMPGSSITLGEVTVESEINFVARATDVPVNGRTEGTSILKAETGNEYYYLGQENEKDYSKLGSFKPNNAKIEE